MPKVLIVKQREECNGCELCVMEAQRQLKKVGLNDSLIRIFRKSDPEKDTLQFSIEIDPRIEILDIEKIKNICPKLVFEIEEREE